MDKRRIGKEQEAVAIAFLEGRGYQLIETNFWCRQGEIDIIAAHNGYHVFIEVKYRKDEGSGHPGESLSQWKMRRIVRATEYYMLARGISEDAPCRFDVVSIVGDKAEVIENAFDASFQGI